MLRAGADALNTRGSGARERLTQVLGRAREAGRRVQEQTVAGAKATDRTIRNNPYQSMGIAFGVGLLIGVILNRK